MQWTNLGIGMDSFGDVVRIVARHYSPPMRKKEMKEPVFAGNEFIQSRFKFTAREIDIVARIIHMVNGSQLSQIELKCSTLMEDIGSKSHNNYAEIRKAFRNMLSNPIEIFNSTEQSFSITNIISGVKILMKRGVVLVNIDPFMVPYLTGLRKNYTSMELHSILQLKSQYAKRLYMMLSQFKSTNIFSIEMDEIRKRLRLEDKYKTFADFNKRVIAPALKEINLHTELNVKLTEKEKGAFAIEALRFMISLKQEVEEVSGNEKQIKFMIRTGLSNWQIENACMLRNPDELAPILRAVYLRFCDKGKPTIADKGAYLVAALSREGINMHKPLPAQQKIPYEQPTKLESAA